MTNTIEKDPELVAKKIIEYGQARGKDLSYGLVADIIPTILIRYFKELFESPQDLKTIKLYKKSFEGSEGYLTAEYNGENISEYPEIIKLINDSGLSDYLPLKNQGQDDWD